MIARSFASALLGWLLFSVATGQPATGSPSSETSERWRTIPARLAERIRTNRKNLPPPPEEEAWIAKLPASILATANLRYADAPGFDPRWTSLDLFRPRDARRAPIVIFVHGGGMSAGDKSPAALVENKARFFPAHGFVFVSVNYRLAPEVAHPVATNDLAAAVNFVRRHAVEWQADPDQLFLIGHSAGAQLVVQMITDDAIRDAHDIPLAAIRGVVSVDPSLYDLPFALAHSGDDWLVRGIVEMVYGASPAAQAAASPINQLPTGRALPPFLLFHANDAQSLSRLSAERFAGRLRSVGGTVELMAAREKDHSHLGRDIGTEGDWITDAVMRFIAQNAARKV